jgi:hypothetical protein
MQIAEWERRAGKPCPRCHEDLPADLDEWAAGVYVDEGEVNNDFALQTEPMHAACLEPLEQKRLIREDPAEAEKLGMVDEAV